MHLGFNSPLFIIWLVPYIFPSLYHLHPSWPFLLVEEVYGRNGHIYRCQNTITTYLVESPTWLHAPPPRLTYGSEAWIDLTQLTMQPIWPTLHPYNSETAQRNKPESIWPSYNAVDLTNIASLQLPKFVNQPLAWLMALDKPKSIRLSYNVIDSTNIVSWRFKEEAPCGCKLVSRHQRLFVHSHATILRHYNHCVFGWYVWTPVRFSLPGITRVDRHRWTSNNPNVSRIDKPVCMWDR